jgi:ribosomal protein L29
MKTKEFKDLRAKSIKELQKLAYEKRLEHAKKKMDITAGKEKNLKAASSLRNEVVRILTVVREKEILEKIEGGKTK